MKKTILLGISLFIAGVGVSQTQIGNSNFESWENVSGGSEPVNWNGFLTAQGGWAWAAANQMQESADVRPGSTGVKSCRINARSAFGIIANGNVTLGRINMGSTTPADASNYNVALTNNATYSEVMTNRPDSIVFWAKYIPGNGSTTNEARMKASVHAAYNYRDPEDAAATAQVVASAVQNYTQTNNQWVRFSVPFVYTTNPVTQAYVLVTFTTNKTPGGGHADDLVFIDDVELKYNQAPVANADAYSGDENLDIVCNVLSNDTDAENNINTGSVTIVTPPTNGSVAVSGTGVITYTPNLNYFGSDSFVYNFSDNGNQIESSNNATVSITVNAVNQAIVANIDNYFTPMNTDVVCNVLSNDVDVENEINISSITVTQQPVNGTLLVNTTTGAITYTPDNGFLGTDSYIYEICDAGNPAPVYCDTALVTVNVFDPLNNQPMIANNDTYSAGEGMIVNCNVLANDVDPENDIDASSLEILVQPTNGNAVVSAGQIVYTPNLGFIGTDVLEYKVCDNGSPTFCDSATVSITLTSTASVDQFSIADVEIKVVGNAIQFKGFENNSGTYYVYDLIGQLVQKGKISSQVAFTQKSGVYLITVESSLGAKTKRVFKN